MAAVAVGSDFGAQENKTVSTFSLPICYEVKWPDDFSFSNVQF